MPITKSSATAFINVRGLGIVCFNPQKKRCETAIIRSGDHKLTLNIYKPAFIESGGADKLGYTPVFSREITETEDVSIEISGNGNPQIGGYELFETESFNRLENDINDNDIRWILNLEGEEMHNESLVKNEQFAVSEKPSVTKLFIENGLFYSVMPNEKEILNAPFFRKFDPQNKSEEDFGFVAETMGVNIESDEVTVKLKIGGTENNWSLPRIEGLPYKIEITNVDPNPDAPLSDLFVCYKFLSAADSTEFELRPKEQTSSAGSSVTGKQYCHITRVDQETIEVFI
ncbi:MAG TPA: hypothetical protein PKY59_06295 [Pyrinomonadaceae bacterium]|nr:hypothetical protein [Pyrinomonadaceae bacterium]